MAYTSIIPVHRLKRSIDYIKDKKKTALKPEHADSLEEAIDYALNREKTEQMVYEDSLGCTCENAYDDMIATKKRFHKMDGVQGYHLIQSFAAGEVSPELAHLIGLELAEQLLKGQFEVVITTHLNTAHYHNHLVFNSVSMEDGHKYHSNSRSYYKEIRRISDALCRKYRLSVIQTTSGTGISYAQWKAQKEGKPTWRTGIRMDIREAVQGSFTWKQFIFQMEQKGYEWKLNQKFVALRAPGMERFVRLKSLGENYTETSIRTWLLQPKSYQKQISGREKRGGMQGQKKRSGLQALYYSYLYQMGVFKKRPQRTSFAIQADIRRLDERIAQLDFLQKYGITTREQLTAHRRPLEEKMLALMKERSHLYRSEPGSLRIREITEALKPLRKEVKLSLRIDQHSREIEQRLLEAKKLEIRGTKKKEAAIQDKKAKAAKEQEKTKQGRMPGIDGR